MIRHAPWAEPPADFKIGLRVIPADQWFEGGEAEAGRKQALLAKNAGLVWGETAGSEAGQAEAAGMVEQATGARIGEGPALWTASLLVADDLCLMQRDPAGQWRLTAVSLTQPTFFTVPDALGKSLAELHGPVPGFADRFGARVERMFDAVSPGVIMERRNWTVVNSGEANLPERATLQAQLPSLPLDQAASGLWLRVERQTVRKLPQTGAVLFTVRAWRCPLADLANDRVKKQAFAEAWASASQEFRAYKGLEAYDEWVSAFLASG